MCTKECRLAVVVTGLVLVRAFASLGGAADEKAVDLAAEYESAIEDGRIDDLVRQLTSKVKTSSGTAELEAAASALAASGDGVAAMVRRVVRHPSPLAPSVAAELLWRIASKGRLTDELAAVAGELLVHDDPFVGALAEWAIATRVGMDNGGQEIVWPKAEQPAWFERWIALGPEFLIDVDYARLAIVWNVHHDAEKLLGSVDKIIQRARGAASEVLASGSASTEETRATVTRQLDRLESIRREFETCVRGNPEEIAGPRRLWLAARRAARPIILANPAVDFQELLFIKRHPAHSHRNITGSQYPWVHKPGGDIRIQTGLKPGGKVRSVIRGQLGPGHVHGMDLAWDADRVVFAYASQTDWPPELDTVLGNDVFRLRAWQEPTHIYEINADGTHLAQVTDDPYWSDLEPTYCASGDVVFASDRSGRSSECGKFSADHTVINIYAVSPDGVAVSRPKQFGSHKSRLIRVLLDDRLHREEAKLAREEWIALVTWVDANAPYHDRFYNRRPEDGAAPRRDVVMGAR